ncbi:MAG TPA: hypothetical protein VG496_04140 [Myxococcales bacterium]|nr:hypothetical protein [Myxococcales bacterium]
MPATRLLVLADPKMLLALANGLREGAKFDVLTLPFGDPGAPSAAQRADALAIFYGSPAQPLQSLVQDLAPALRSRGGRVVAVLQRDQVAQRDDCFRAGASDLLFMPLPKEQFVSRLAASVALSYPKDPGVSAPVQIGARGNLIPLAQASVTAAGVHAPGALPFDPGETVRISWGTFECWGLVARASPDSQVRFAGLAPDEEARIREWVKANGAGANPGRPEAPPAATSVAPKPPSAAPPPQRTEAAPAVPSADRVVKPAARPVPPPSAAPPPPPAAHDGPTWPTVGNVDACKTAGISVLREKKPPADAPPELAAAARKVVGVLNVLERNALEQAGADSHFAAAMAARIVLELARAEAVRLMNGQPHPHVDEDAMRAVTQIVDAAGARLQKEVDVAIARADVDKLQLLTVANAALSRDLLVFKEAADRLRGIGTAPRIAAGALDPEVVLTGQSARPIGKSVVDRPPRPELREFDGLGERPHRGRKLLLLLSVAAAAAAVAHATYLYPRITVLREPIPGVARVEISGKTARVTLAQDFVDNQARAIAILTQTLRARAVERALLVQRNGSVAGQLAVREGKTIGLASQVKETQNSLEPAPAPPGPAPAPPVPAPPQTNGPSKPPAQVAATPAQ